METAGFATRQTDKRTDKRGVHWLGMGLIVVLAWSTSACGKGAKISALNSRSVVVCFGDSLTFGAGAPSEKSYPRVLAERLGCRVINAGQSGETSAQGLKRLASVLDLHRPSLVVVCHGGNDFLKKMPEAETETNIRTMIDRIREAGADAMLVGVPKPGLILSAADLFGRIARDKGVPYEGKIVPSVLSKSSLKSDYVHPNEAGYRMMADAIAACIRAASAR